MIVTGKRKQSQLKLIVIKNWRKRMKLASITQRALSAESDLSAQSISKIMSGLSVNLRDETIDAIEDALDRLEARNSLKKIIEK